LVGWLLVFVLPSGRQGSCSLTAIQPPPAFFLFLFCLLGGRLSGTNKQMQGGGTAVDFSVAHHGQQAAAASAAAASRAASGGGVVVPDMASEIILPPPSPGNPIPALPVALRLDNQEQLVQFLRTDPHGHGGAAAATAPGAGGNFRQLLVFGTDGLRTLLMRQVLSDPHARMSNFKGKKKNWDGYLSYPLPRALQQSVVGTRLLDEGSKGAAAASDPVAAAVREGDNGDGTGAVPPIPEEGWGILEDGNSGVDVVTYFLRPSDLRQTQRVAERIRSFRRQFRVHHRICYVPEPTAVVQKLVTNLGLTSAPNVSVHGLQLDVFPLESDVLSLEYDDAVRETTEVEGTPSNVITTVARSILKLQDVVGKIPRIQGYGPLAEEVVRKVLNVTVDEYLASNSATDGDASADVGGDDCETGPVAPTPHGVAAMVIIDRRVDSVTPMLTPLTYEGLLDDVVGIDCGFIRVKLRTINPPEDEDDDDKSKRKKKGGDFGKTPEVGDDDADEAVALGLNGSDSLYAEVRNQHVEKFGSFLQNQAKALQDTHANFTSQGKKKDLSEIHQFVKQIPIFTQNLRSLTNHIHLAELVKKTSEEATFRERWQLERSMLEGETCYEQLEELLASQYPPMRFFRLLCLQSLCSGGIKSSRYDQIRRDIVQTYGFPYLFFLNHLEKAGLLSRREGLWMDTASPFNNLRKSLLLINAEVDTVEPDDVSYVSSGYAPITVRLLQTAMKGWTGREEILREGPGRLVDVTQHNPPEDLAAALKRPVGSSLGQLAIETAAATNTGSKKPVLLVFYVGGVTYMELASLRFLSKRPKFPYNIIVATTKVVNGGTLLHSLA